MRGERDQHLQWPVTGKIDIELINWADDKNHYKMTLSIDASKNFVRVTNGEFGNSIGYQQFIPHSSLSHDSQYVYEDCLRFRVSIV